MKTIICAICVICGCFTSPAGEIIRDPAGNVITITTTTATGKTTRDAAGAVLEQKQTIRYPDKSKTIIVRDQSQAVIRMEAKDSKPKR